MPTPNRCHAPCFIWFLLAIPIFAFAQGGRPMQLAPLNGLATLSEYVFITPPTWTATMYSDGIVLMSSASVTNERCVVTISPMRPSGGANLLAEADNIFRDVYKAYQKCVTSEGKYHQSSGLQSGGMSGSLERDCRVFRSE